MMRRALVGAMIAAIPLTALAQAENYTIDPIHSYVNFSVDHLGFTTIYGRFDKSSGKATLDRAARSASIEVSVETASVSTGDNDKGARARSRDEHLRAADFFNSTEFPRMTFKSTAARFSGDALAEVDGQVTLLGVTKPLTLRLERWKCGTHPFNKKEMCGGVATGKVKRTDFGMKYGVPAIGDEISLMIGFEAYKD